MCEVWIKMCPFLVSPVAISERQSPRQSSVYSSVGALGWIPVKEEKVARLGWERNQYEMQTWTTVLADSTGTLS